MLDVYYIKERITVGELIGKFKQSKMLRVLGNYKHAW